MIAFPASVRVWLAVGRTDMRRGMQGLALQVQQVLGRNPHAGDLYVFRGCERRSDKNFVARRHRYVAVCKTSGEGSFCMALASRRGSRYLGRTGGLYARWNRLAKPTPYLPTDKRRIKA
jgi:transposase